MTLLIQTKINEGVILEIEGSYKNLLSFILDRSIVKKAIMTIPYNVSQINMKKYIKDTLHLIEEKSDVKLQGYSKTNSKRITSTIHKQNVWK